MKRLYDQRQGELLDKGLLSRTYRHSARFYRKVSGPNFLPRVEPVQSMHKQELTFMVTIVLCLHAFAVPDNRKLV